MFFFSFSDMKMRGVIEQKLIILYAVRPLALWLRFVMKIFQIEMTKGNYPSHMICRINIHNAFETSHLIAARGHYTRIFTLHSKFL